jgi:hypothetical protein
MLRTSRLLAAGAFLVGILLGASVCGAASGAGPDASTATGQPMGAPGADPQRIAAIPSAAA